MLWFDKKGHLYELALLCRIYYRPAAPSELNDEGGALPPVSPEVINILLLQRSRW